MNTVEVRGQGEGYFGFYFSSEGCVSISLWLCVCVSFYVQISGTRNVENELIMASFLIKT